MIAALGVTQILAWGSSYYLPAVLAEPIARDTHWPLTWVVGGLSIGLVLAALVSPHVGKTIERLGGRPVLALSALAIGVGQIGLAMAPNLPSYIGAWVVIGVGMGAGLYDAAFATLGRLYGHDARSAITSLTLFGGFASTVCWPLSAFLVVGGWLAGRLPRLRGDPARGRPSRLSLRPAARRRRSRPLDPTIPARRRTPMRLRSSMALCRAFGCHAHPGGDDLFLNVSAPVDHPSGQWSRAGRRRRPWRAGRSLAGGGASGRDVHRPLPSSHLDQDCVGELRRYRHARRSGPAYRSSGLRLAFYGAGIGLESIARGTLPLALFGARGYATLMGRLAMPSLLAQATAPWIGAVLLERFGAHGTLAALACAAGLNVALALWLAWMVARR